MLEPFLLFAEDDLLDAELLTFACERAGVPASRYSICKSGSELISFLQEAQLAPDNPRSPTRIVTDFRMPMGDGMTVISWVASHARFKNVPVSLLSSNLNDLEKARARELGAAEVLQKPREMEELVSLVKRWYHGDGPTTSARTISSNPAPPP